MKETAPWPPRIDTKILNHVTRRVMRQSLDQLQTGLNAELLSYVIAKILGETGCSAHAVVTRIDTPPEGLNGYHYVVRLAGTPNNDMQVIDPGYLGVAHRADISTLGLPGSLITSRNDDSGALIWPVEHLWPVDLVEMLEPAHMRVFEGSVDVMRRFGREEAANQIVGGYMKQIVNLESVQN